ncbi:glutamine transport system permease protein GlnP [Roseovarius sp. A-2]|uniref:amino acid ABC transporter permease n=1 Tax=Roseovarius sp. A-2 TaxID=1570360 RepID=UPI0009D30BF2|nr:amino acid ABC transporter permease [Roseovarius sp. A-2]GAW37214.1 glutamine transport system permease protein GlnP [Roseovarius sp. A-2]
MIVEIIINHIPYLLDGLWVAIQLLVCLLAIGFVFGLLLALAEVYGHWTLRASGMAFERVFRGIPELVLILMCFYGVGNWYPIEPFPAAVLALGLRSTAYQSQIFRGVIQAVPKGQIAAARAIGMSGVQAVRYVVLPQALRQVPGPWSNEFSSELKATSLAYVIGVVELTRQGRYIISSTQGNILIVFAVVALMYFVVNWLGNRVLYRAERALEIPGLERRESD